jgi:hypothetical protein
MLTILTNLFVKINTNHDGPWNWNGRIKKQFFTLALFSDKDEHHHMIFLLLFT